MAALEGEPATPGAPEALEEAGVRADDHRARWISAEMIEEVDLVVGDRLAPRREAFGTFGSSE